ncbi:MAG: type 1 glutamine amidotransferase domain-containing protein [Verrucomicrobiota bacterium]
MKRNTFSQTTLFGKKVAILAEEGFERSELEKPRLALEEAGAITHVISPSQKKIRGWRDGEYSGEVKVDLSLDAAHAEDYDALLLPGGVLNPDKLRQIPEAVQFVRSFFLQGKPVGAICHGPQLLIEADVLQGKTVTSYSSIKTDLINAGANWVDTHVVVDQSLITSRKPDDIPYFNEKLIEEIAKPSTIIPLPLL